MFEVPITLVPAVLANVTAILVDPGVLLVVGAAVALPLGFWGIRQIIGLFPKSRGK